MHGLVGIAINVYFLFPEVGGVLLSFGLVTFLACVVYLK